MVRRSISIDDVALQQPLRASENEVTAPVRKSIQDLTTKLAAARELKERLAWEASELKRALERADREVHELTEELTQAREDLVFEQRLRQHHEAATGEYPTSPHPTGAEREPRRRTAVAQVSIE